MVSSKDWCRRIAMAAKILDSSLLHPWHCCFFFWLILSSRLLRLGRADPRPWLACGSLRRALLREDFRSLWAKNHWDQWFGLGSDTRGNLNVRAIWKISAKSDTTSDMHWRGTTWDLGLSLSMLFHSVLSILILETVQILNLILEFCSDAPVPLSLLVPWFTAMTRGSSWRLKMMFNDFCRLHATSCQLYWELCMFRRAGNANQV